MGPLLVVEDVHTGYGQVPVLHGVSFTVNQGETAVMLGLNGAGKSTTVMTIAGLLERWAGRIMFEDEPIHDIGVEDLVERGIVLVPEGRHVFPGLSVVNNLRLGGWPARKDAGKVRERTERVYEVFPRLAERRSQLAGTLSGGEQQMLAIGRGLMAEPKLLLIDEASLGLSPKLAQDVFQTAKRINAEGVTVILVEQNAGALRYADRAFIMQKGQIIYEGAGDDLLKPDELRQAYLG